MQIEFETKNEAGQPMFVEAYVWNDRMEGVCVEVEAVMDENGASFEGDYDMSQIEGEAMDAYYTEH